MTIAVVHVPGGWWEVEGREFKITLERRRPGCDRGNFIAKLHPVPGSMLALEIDGQDAWPRYYFSWGAMLDEVEAWLRRRDQLVDQPDAAGHVHRWSKWELRGAPHGYEHRGCACGATQTRRVPGLELAHSQSEKV